jgi:hypothetical protein
MPSRENCGICPQDSCPHDSHDSRFPTIPKARNRPLVLALARAYKWQRMIESGEMPGVDAIATQLGVGRAYVSRILKLAMLAPELAEAAVKGSRLVSISLRRLMVRGVPVCWDQQRAICSTASYRSGP